MSTAPRARAPLTWRMVPRRLLAAGFELESRELRRARSGGARAGSGARWLSHPLRRGCDRLTPYERRAGPPDGVIEERDVGQVAANWTEDRSRSRERSARDEARA